MMDGIGPDTLTWKDGNREITALILRRAACRVTAEDPSAWHVERQIEEIAKRMPGPSVVQRLIRRFELTEAELESLAVIALSEQEPKLSALLEADPLACEGRATRAVLHVLGMADPERLVSLGLIVERGGGRRFERALEPCVAAIAALDGRMEVDPIWSDLAQPFRARMGQASRTLVAALGKAAEVAEVTGHAPQFHAATDPGGRIAASLALFAQVSGLPVLKIATGALPYGADRAALARAMGRDLAICPALPVFRAPEADPAAVWEIADTLTSPCVVIGAPPMAGQGRHVVPVPPPQDQPLDADDGAGHMRIARHWHLDPLRIEEAADAVAWTVAPDIWTAAQGAAGGDLDAVADRIETRASWEDLVLPPAQMAALEQMALFLGHREQVTSDWGFAAKSARGLGMAALFHGASGTGKTSAAEAVTGRIAQMSGRPVDLWRVNVSGLVSKYIGETSKNFQTLFRAGAARGAALVFDECEGLFGRRARQGRDSLDKHSNAELGFLLQCLESYPGVAILTTNLRDAIDDAFFRRFRFAIEFPFPDRAMRALIWQRVLPEALPTQGLDTDLLAALPLSGGHIRAIAVNAAYLAASDEAIVTMAYMAQAARWEFAKLEKPVPERDLAAWGTP